METTLQKIEIGTGVTKLGYTDMNPYEVVKVCTERKIIVREMDAMKDETVKMDFVPGGFSAVCTNNNQQRWIITSNAGNQETTIRLHKGGQWKDCHGNRYSVGKAVKFYDYNF